MNAAAIPDNITPLPRRFCACGCGQIAPYGKYVGKPKSREYNQHAKAASRKRAKSDVKRSQTDVKADTADLEVLMRRVIREELARLRIEPPQSTPVPRKAASAADFEIEVTEAKTDGGKSTQNFFTSLNAIATDYKSQKVVQSNPKAMDVPQFEVEEIEVEGL